MKKLLLIALGFTAFQTAKAQDMLIFKDKTVEEVKIIEVTPDFIKYREFGADENAAVFSVEKDFLNKVIFETGKVLDMSKSLINDERIYADQRRRAIKLDVAGISSNYSFITYEQAIDPSTSWEAGFLFIGAGFDSGSLDGERENAMGGGVNVGYKFKRSPNFYMSRMKYGHIMRGTYIKPNLFVTLFNYDLVDYNHPPDPVTFMYPTTRETAVAASAQLDFGNQLVLSDQFVVDYAFGVGYGFTTKQNTNQWWTPPAVNYGFTGGRRQGVDWNGNTTYSSPLTYSVTLRVGYLMKN
ncbi:MAG: hypothetical protein RL754_206 [Bacteroidota bacterium]|jgi:hypothetical protein